MRAPTLRVFWIAALSCLLAAAWPAESRTAASLAPPLSAQRHLLPNGLVIILAQKTKLPIAIVKLLVRGGAAHDAEDKSGLANLVARLLDKGAAGRSARQVAEAIEFLGGSLSIRAGALSSQMSLEVLSKDIDAGFELLSDVLLRPRLATAEIERERKIILSEIAGRLDNPHQAVGDAFRELLYHGHVLHRPTEGYEHTVRALTRSDVLTWSQRYYRPERAILVMVSDLAPARMLRLIQTHLGDWRRGATSSTPMAEPPPPRGLRIHVVDRRINQSYVQLGHLGVRRSNPDYNALRAMNYILGGGGFVSRLYGTVREKLGLAYSVYSYFTPGGPLPGRFVVGLQTKIDSTSQALSVVFNELERIRREPVSAVELAEMKQYYQGSLPRRTESYGQIASLLLDQEYYGLPAQFWKRDIEEIQQLEAADLLRVARRYLKPQHLAIAIASRRAALDLNTPALRDATYINEPLPRR